MGRLIPLLFLVGCSGFYPKPDPGIYTLEVIVVEQQATVAKWCKMDALACMKRLGRQCQVMVTQDDWEIHMNHEMAHCFAVYTHE